MCNAGVVCILLSLHQRHSMGNQQLSSKGYLKNPARSLAECPLPALSGRILTPEFFLDTIAIRMASGNFLTNTVMLPGRP